MVQEYLARRTIDHKDIRVMFETGDSVLLKAKVAGKMKCRSTGPYIFLRYTGRLGVTACILNSKGKEYEVSVANLLPMYPPTARLARFEPPELPSEIHNSDSDSTSPMSPSSSINNESLPPPGTILVPPPD